MRQALEGRVRPHHRLLLTQLLGHIDDLTTAIAEIEQEVERCLVPFAEVVTLLQTIPGSGGSRQVPVTRYQVVARCCQGTGEEQIVFGVADVERQLRRSQ